MIFQNIDSLEINLNYIVDYLLEYIVGRAMVQYRWSSSKCALLHGMTFHDTDQFFLNQLSRNTLMFVMKKQSKAQSFRFWHDWFQDLDQKYTIKRVANMAMEYEVKFY